MSLGEFRKHLEAKFDRKEKKHKYKAKKTENAGYSFASKLESSVFSILHLLMKAGEIADIQIQDTVLLSEAEIIYKPDFKVTRPNGSVYWVEAKGFKTQAWAIKKRLWRTYGPGRLEIWEGNHGNPFLAETIDPKSSKDDKPGTSP